MTTTSPLYITGANGFLGQKLCQKLGQDFRIVPLLRKDLQTRDKLTFEADSSIIHTAARVHVIDEKHPQPQEAFYKTNVELTLEIAQKAIQNKCRQFIFISSLSVYGRFRGGEITQETSPHPDDFYGSSKYQAEQKLRDLFKEASQTKLIILRLPMVYGPNNKGNLLALLKMAEKKILLPLGKAEAKRSFLYIENLISAIKKIITTPEAPKRDFFLLHDERGISTKDLYQTLFQAMNQSKGTFCIPVFVMRLLGSLGSVVEFLFRKKIPLNTPTIKRLFDTFVIREKLFNELYSWEPPYETKEGLIATAKWFKRDKT